MTDQLLPAIRRGRIDRLNIYEVTDSELHLLERGSPESLFLNFAVFLLSTAISFLVTLLSTEIGSARVFSVFVILTVLGFILGTLLLALWWWHRRSSSLIIEEIRRRMPPEGIPSDASVIIDTQIGTENAP